MKRLPGRFGKITGFSLVELMISIVVGLIVIAGVISIFSSAIKSYSDNLKMTRLNQELRVVMDMMVRDIRRAGYWGNALSVASTTNPNTFNTGTNRIVVGSPGNSNLGASGTSGGCILYAYDDNGVGGLQDSEKRGYRLDVVGGVGVIRTRQGGGTPTNDCSFGGVNMESVTDASTVHISTLTFMINTVCPFASSTRTVQLVSNTPSAQYRIIRAVQITLTGQLISDPSISRTLQETVRVQNDEIADTNPGGAAPAC